MERGIATTGSSIDEVLMISEQNASNASVVGGLYGRPERGKSSRFTKSSKANESGEGWCTIGDRKVAISACLNCFFHDFNHSFDWSRTTTRIEGSMRSKRRVAARPCGPAPTIHTSVLTSRLIFPMYSLYLK